jgi:hypothetical protein
MRKSSKLTALYPGSLRLATHAVLFVGPMDPQQIWAYRVLAVNASATSRAILADS